MAINNWKNNPDSDAKHKMLAHKLYHCLYNCATTIQGKKSFEGFTVVESHVSSSQQGQDAFNIVNREVWRTSLIPPYWYRSEL